MSDVLDRIARRVQVDENGCHVFMGARTPKGYGHISIGGRKTDYTHRLMYVAANGPIEDGLEIDHLCRNQSCCNPDHLEAVTRSENLLRAMSVKYTGVRGVYYNPNLSPKKPWRAGICRNGKTLHLGLFATREDAVNARLAAEADHQSSPERQQQILARKADLENEPGGES